MSKQTTIQASKTIRKGSVRVYVGANFSSLVDVGALRNPVFKSLAEDQAVKFDNVADLNKFVNGQRASISFDLAEVNFDNIAVLDGGILTLATVAGTPVAVVAEAHGTGWTIGQPIGCTFKNGDNSIVASIVVKSGATTLALTTDYKTYVGDGSNGTKGVTYITPVSAQAGAITFGYSYTPNASKKITFSDSGTKTLNVMRIVNTDENDKQFKIDIQNGTNFTPISVNFASDIKDDVAILPISFQGDIVEWVDEQGA